MKTVFSHLSYLQAWSSLEELDQFRDPVNASRAAEVEDITGGRGEKQIDAVWRKIREQYVVRLPVAIWNQLLQLVGHPSQSQPCLGTLYSNFQNSAFSKPRRPGGLHLLISGITALSLVKAQCSLASSATNSSPSYLLYSPLLQQLLSLPWKEDRGWRPSTKSTQECKASSAIAM